MATKLSAQPSTEPVLRIGELARRAGIPPATLRAWERRYEIVEPSRTESGYRLYSERDEAAVRDMVDLITRGLAPAEAARQALENVETAVRAADEKAARDGGAPDRGPGGDEEAPGREMRADLLAALIAYDDRGAHGVLDRAFASYSIEALIGDLVLPVLRDVGEGWSAGRISVGQEHFSSNLLRGRLLGLSRGWGSGGGPVALLACPAGEFHDLGLISFGLVLREHGWRVFFLGTDTPVTNIAAAAREIEPAAIVLCAMISEVLTPAEMAELSGGAPVMVAGSGVDEKRCVELGVRYLEDDPVVAALGLTR